MSGEARLSIRVALGRDDEYTRTSYVVATAYDTRNVDDPLSVYEYDMYCITTVSIIDSLEHPCEAQRKIGRYLRIVRCRRCWCGQ